MNAALDEWWAAFFVQMTYISFGSVSLLWSAFHNAWGLLFIQWPAFVLGLVDLRFFEGAYVFWRGDQRFIQGPIFY